MNDVWNSWGFVKGVIHLHSMVMGEFKHDWGVSFETQKKLLGFPKFTCSFT